MDKYEIAHVLREIGIILELTDPNPSKGLAYRKAAYTVESIPDLKQAVEQNMLESFPGIGKTISGMISTLVQKGSLPYHQTLKQKIPASLFDLVLIPGLGLRRLRFLYETFQVKTIEDLENTLKNPSFTKVKNFGPAFIDKLLKKIDVLKTKGRSLLYPQAINVATVLIKILENVATKIELVGDLRRKLEVIYEIDLLIETEAPAKCVSIITLHELVNEILHQTPTFISFSLKQSIIINLHITTHQDFLSNLIILTGNEKHIEDLRTQATRLGYHSLEEVFDKKIKSENTFYQRLELPYICPELREGFGEIEAGIDKTLPHLIEEKDLKGTFHCHTVDSDGSNTLEELVEGAKELGWEYIGIADHSKSSYQANGMDEEKLFLQIENIHRFNTKTGSSFKLFSGIECDILKDGQLDFSNDVLKQLDYVIVSIHRFFNLEEKEMTNRLIKAIENPYTTMVGHLTGRLLRHRDPYQLDIPKIIDACVANQKIIELNAYPSRMDMDWRWWIKGKEKGLKCAINPDAHSLKDLQNCYYGVNSARKGWLEKEDVINTLSLNEMKRYLQQRKP